MEDIGAMDYELSQAYRTVVFNMVCNKENWKMPIDATIPYTGNHSHLITAISDAVIHFTGSVPVFTVNKDTIRVTAAGYYEAIGT